MSSNLNWLDKNEYPFAPHYLNVGDANMHYVDVGKGDAIVFVHGTPSWSFDYRNVIKELSKTNRCIALDHIGFGLSDKPENYNYTLKQHTENLTHLLRHLKLDKFTMVVHDFGGPIGFGYAVQTPEKIKGLVVLNTWLWNTRNEPEFKKAEFILKSPLLPLLYKYFNFSARFIVKQSWGNKATLTKAVHAHYTAPFSKPAERMGTIAFAKALLSEQNYFEDLWNKADVLVNKPTQFIWGVMDEIVPVRFMERFLLKFKNAKAAKVQAGHFVQDEAHEEVTSILKRFLATL